jgi:hypothetical protein
VERTSGAREGLLRFATAPMTRATWAVGCTISSMSWLTEKAPEAQLPVALRTLPRSPLRPSLPTTRERRSNSRVN